MRGPIIFTQEWCDALRPRLDADERHREAIRGADLRMWFVILDCPEGFDRLVEQEWRGGELKAFHVADECPSPDPRLRRLEFAGPLRVVDPSCKLGGLPRLEYREGWWGGISGTYHALCDLVRPAKSSGQAVLSLRQAYLDPRVRLDQRAVEFDSLAHCIQGHLDACSRANREVEALFPEHQPGGGPRFAESFRAWPDSGPRIFTQAWADLTRPWLNASPSYLKKAHDMQMRLWYVICDCPGGVDLLVEHDWRKRMLVSRTVWERPAGDVEWRELRFDRTGWLGGFIGTWHAMCDLHRPTQTEPVKTLKELLAMYHDPRFRCDLSNEALYRYWKHIQNYLDCDAQACQQFGVQFADHIPLGGLNLAEVLARAEAQQGVGRA